MLQKLIQNSGQRVIVVIFISCLVVGCTKEALKQQNESRLKKVLAEEKYDKIDSLLLIKNNKLLEEYYANNYDAKKKHEIASITKSITSLLVGIAVDKSYIKDLEHNIYDYYKSTPYEFKWTGERKAIRIRDLLTMQHGFACDDFADSDMSKYNAWVNSHDKIAAALEMPLKTSPGVSSSYCTATTELLHRVLEKSTGMSVDKFAKQYLFKPLAIHDFEWKKLTNGLSVANKQQVALGHGAKMRPSDIAKLGKLVMNKGLWKGKRIVSEAWINQSLQGVGKVLGIDYGFLWYGEPYEINGRMIRSYLAMGYAGQFLIIFPDLGSILVINAQDYEFEIDFYSLIQNKILPLIL